MSHCFVFWCMMKANTGISERSAHSMMRVVGVCSTNDVPSLAGAAWPFEVHFREVSSLDVHATHLNLLARYSVSFLRDFVLMARMLDPR